MGGIPWVFWGVGKWQPKPSKDTSKDLSKDPQNTFFEGQRVRAPVKLSADAHVTECQFTLYQGWAEFGSN